MREEFIFEAIADIDERFVCEAADVFGGKSSENKQSAVRKNNIGRWLVAAACACAVAVAAVLIKYNFGNSKQDIQITENSKNALIAEDSTDYVNDKDDSNSESSDVSGEVAFPADWSATEWNTEDGSLSVSYSDELGMVVYNGKIYEQAASYYEDTDDIDALLGDYLGHANGVLGTWAAVNYDSKNLNDIDSNVEGDVYSVKGWDTDFRICLKIDGEDGTISCLQFLECLNDITLYSGSDLFEDRLHLRDNFPFADVTCLEEKSGNRGNVTLEADTWNEFLNALDEGKFVQLQTSGIHTGVHLIIKFNDGTYVKFRLYDDGYISYNGLGKGVANYAIKLPDNVYNEIYEACLRSVGE
jgi:hypothetical protein